MGRLLLVVTLALVSGAFAAEVAITAGMSEAKLIDLMGSPASKAAMGKKAIYRWPDVQVTLVEGKVDQIQYRDRATEKQNASERRSTEAQKRAETRQATTSANESSAAAKNNAARAQNARDRGLERTVTLQAYIVRLERELERDSQRSSFGRGTPPMSAEAKALIALRIEEARKEISELR